MRDDLLACTTRDELDDVLAKYGTTDTSEIAQAVGGVDYEVHTITAPGLTITFHQWPANNSGYGPVIEPSPIDTIEVSNG